MTTIDFNEMPKGAQKRFKEARAKELKSMFVDMGFKHKPSIKQNAEHLQGEIRKHVFAREKNTYFYFVPKIIFS